MADQEEPLFSFTAPQFENLMETRGLANTTRVLVEDGNEMLGGNVMTYESLKDGTAPILDMFPDYADLSPDERRLNDEQILNIFTNVEDYGKYDVGSTGEGAGQRTFIARAGRAAPEAIGGGVGFTSGIKAGLYASSFIPPIGLPGLLAKGVVIVGGGIIGSILGATVAGEAEDAVLGEAAPVMPSLEGSARGGEGLVFGLSMLHAPWALSPSKVRKGGAGAIEFIDNFKNVASGQFSVKAADKAIELTAKNAGLSAGAYAAANAARETAKKGPMFGGFRGVTDNPLGLGRINPQGYIFDPLKGPLTGRIMSGVESGIGKSMEGARNKAGRFIGIETGAALGASGLSIVAQNLDPYDDTTRFLAELGGAMLVPLPVQLLAEKGPTAVKSLYGTMKNYMSSDARQGLLQGKINTEAGKRILLGLEESAEYTGPEQVDAFINSLMKQSVDENGKAVPGTVKSLAAAFGMPLNRTLGEMEDQIAKVSDELSVATNRGRDQMLIQAKGAIETLVQTGDPTAMAYAARLQQSIFEQNIIENLETRVSKFYNAAEKVFKNSPEAGSQQVDLSQQLYTVLKKQIDNSKKVERALWSEVGDFDINQFKAKNGRLMSQPNILNLLNKKASEGGLKMRSKAGQARLNMALGSLQEDFQDFNKYFNPSPGEALNKNPVSSQRLIEMRQAAQDEAAKLRTAGQVQIAQKMDLIAETLLRDLNGVDSSADPAYQAARAYTYARNNVYTRSFLGELQAKNKKRAYSLSPDALVEKLFRGGNRATLERINEINSAGAFGMEHFLKDAALNQATTQETLDLVMRDSLRQVMDKKPVINPQTKLPTGEFEYVVNQTKLDTFRKKPGTQELFSVFPQLQRDLASAETVKNLQVQADSELTNLGKSIGTIAFQNVLDYADKPSEAVAKALTSNAPGKSLTELVNLAKATPDGVDEVTGFAFTAQDALMGLRNSIFDHATINSGGSGLRFNPTAFEDHLFGQIKGVSPNVKMTLMDVMRDNGMITTDEVNKIQNGVKQMRGVQEAFATGDLQSVLFKKPTLAKTMYAKMIGATAGQKMQEQLNNLLKKIGLGTQGGGIGGGMVAAEGGSTAIQQLLLRGPESMTVKTMSNFFAHPELLGPLLKEIRTKQQADAAMKALAEGFAGLSRQTGRRLPYALRYVTEEEDETISAPAPEQEYPVVPLRPNSSIPPRPDNNQQGSLVPPPIVPTLGGGNPLSVQQASAAPAGPTIQNSGPVDRERFAAMFPNDSTTQLLKSGIGSLGA